MLGWARGGLIQQDWGSQAVEQNSSRGKEFILGQSCATGTKREGLCWADGCWVSGAFPYLQSQPFSQGMARFVMDVT